MDNQNEDLAKKKIDQDWKEAVDKEKVANNDGRGPEVQPAIELNFSLFISSLGMQTLMHLGEIENPLSKSKEKNLNQAKYTIDIISILKDKTKNNLTEEEEKILESWLYELRMKYVAAS